MSLLRLCVVAIGLALLAGCATQGGHRAKVEYFPVEGDPEGKLPFADVVRAGGLLFQSGKLGIKPGTTQLVPGGIQPETRQTMENIRDGFARHGVGMDRVVKCTVFLADMKEWAAMNEVYVQFFPEGKPARSALGVNGLALGARVEIECIAAL
ncbi:MAG: RidA family protein [Actinomycetota bacterium]